MSDYYEQHVGDGQLVYGMPKHMSATVNLSNGQVTESGERIYWQYNPKPHACPQCKAMRGIYFESDPGPVHRNCKCEIISFAAVAPDGHTKIVVPPGVDIQANIMLAKRAAKRCEEKSKEHLERTQADWRHQNANPTLAFLLKCFWIMEHFKTGAVFDYKTRGSQYEAFGNYHYGVITQAMEINSTFAQVCAGAYQLISGTTPLTLKALTTWLDDPDDNKAIKKGQQYPIE